jgi:hypothetical protein
MDSRREKNQKTKTEKYFGRTETKTIKSGKQETKIKTVGRTYRKTKGPPKNIGTDQKPETSLTYTKNILTIKNGLEETLR